MRTTTNSILPWISLEWEARSDILDALWDMGVSGGDTALSTFETWGVSKYLVLETFNATTLWPLEGIEKLRETGGVGSGDAALNTTEGNLLVMAASGFFNTNGAEWPTRGLLDWLPGGLGSSWSSLIRGEETRGGEALGDAFGDEGWGTGKRENPPETGFTDNGLLVNGPEKACLFIFLVSEALKKSTCGSKSPSAEGRGNWVYEVSLSLSLRTEWALGIVGSDNLLSTSFSFFFSSKGEECHKLCKDPLALMWGAELVLVSLMLTGVGRTYALDFAAENAKSCLTFSAGSNFFSASIGAE